MPQIQCEGCTTMLDESEARMDYYPGAVLAWCDQCADTGRAA